MRKAYFIAGLTVLFAAGLYVRYALTTRSAAPASELSPQLAVATAPHTARVIRGKLTVWNHYTGRVDSEKVVTVSSNLGGPAVIVFLVPEGARVNKGDVVVRFDTADAERNLVKLKQDYVTAKSELNSLANAELPIDLEDVKMKLAEQQHKVDQEDKFLRDSTELEKQGLLSAEELNQEQTEAASEQEKLKQLKQKVELTEKYVNPAKIEQAKTKLTAAEEALRIGEQQLADSVVTAPVSGVVSYKPVNIVSEYRTVRLGDTVFRNQPFMMLPDTRHMIVDCYVPESDFDQVAPGMSAAVSPLARPEMAFQGLVQSVETVAGTAPEMPSWQRYFHTVVRLQGEDVRLYPGMSVSVGVLSYSKDDALLVPRAALHWNEGHPYVLERGLLGVQQHSLQVGRSDSEYYEVLGGAGGGDTVLVQ